MKKSVGIFIFDEAEVLDFAGPFEVFSVASEVHDFSLFDVCTIGQTTDKIRAVNGLSVNPDFGFNNHPPLDILIIAGGSGTRALMDNPIVMDWLRKVIPTTQITMSICSGARLLGLLGYLNDAPYCTHHQVYDHMKEIVPNGQPQTQLRYVQSSERIYTSGGISAGIDLSFHIVGKIYDEKVVKATAEYMEYDLKS